MLEVFTLPLGAYYTNCYIIKDSASGERAVIDPGVYTPVLERVLSEKGIQNIRYILLTHGHFDHICGVYALRENFGGEVLIHEADKSCLEDSKRSLADSADGYEQTEMTADRVLADGDRIQLGDTEISVMHTPGHTMGSVCYIADGNIFSGDTLFKRGVGRTDLPGGNLRTLASSLRKIGCIEGEYDIFPGHGESTTLEIEKSVNRLLRAK